MPVIVVKSNSHDSRKALKTDLQNSIGGDLECHETIQHESWERGEPCPECGNTTLSVTVQVEDMYHSENGEYKVSKPGELVFPQTNVTCLECDTTLYSKPVDML